MTDDRDLDELLRLVDDPLPLRGDREDTLLDQLLGDLERGRFTAPFADPAESGFATTVDRDDGPAEIVPIELSRIDRDSSGRRRLMTALLAAAASIALVVGVAVLRPNDGAPVDVTDDQGSRVTTTTEPRPLLSVEAACADFANDAPDRLELRERLSTGGGSVADLDVLLDALDTLVIELDRRDDLSEATLRSVRLARGAVAQARANVAAGSDGSLAFGSADDALRLLQLDDPRFEACWRF